MYFYHIYRPGNIIPYILKNDTSIQPQKTIKPNIIKIPPHIIIDYHLIQHISKYHITDLIIISNFHKYYSNYIYDKIQELQPELQHIYRTSFIFNYMLYSHKSSYFNNRLYTNNKNINCMPIKKRLFEDIPKDNKFIINIPKDNSLNHKIPKRYFLKKLNTAVICDFHNNFYAYLY